MSRKTNTRPLKIMDSISFVAFIYLMLFLWHYLDNLATFLAICIPSTIMFGWAHGNSKLLTKILEEINASDSRDCN